MSTQLRILRVARWPAARRLLSSMRPSDSFLSGSSGVYAEQMYDQWRRDPKR